MFSVSNFTSKASKPVIQQSVLVFSFHFKGFQLGWAILPLSVMVSNMAKRSVFVGLLHGYAVGSNVNVCGVFQKLEFSSELVGFTHGFTHANQLRNRKGQGELKTVWVNRLEVFSGGFYGCGGEFSGVFDVF